MIAEEQAQHNERRHTLTDEQARHEAKRMVNAAKYYPGLTISHPSRPDATITFDPYLGCYRVAGINIDRDSANLALRMVKRERFAFPMLQENLAST